MSPARGAPAPGPDAAPVPRGAAARPRVVLGIDPGTRVVGYGALAVVGDRPRLLAAGVLTAPQRWPAARRLGEIRCDLDQLLAELRPDVVVVERAFAARNVQSALRIGEGRGVVLACAAAFGAEVSELAPSEARRIVVGHGGASKPQVAGMVARLLGLDEPPGSLDATDALALALARVRRDGLRLERA